MNPTPAQHQCQIDAVMTKDQWQQRLSDLRVYDNLPENQQEIARLKAVGEQRGWTGKNLQSAQWADYQYTLVNRLIRDRKKVYNRSGVVLLTFDDVINRAMQGEGREWLRDAYWWLVDGRKNTALDKMEQAIRCAAIELVIEHRDQLDIEPTNKDRSAA